MLRSLKNLLVQAGPFSPPTPAMNDSVRNALRPLITIPVTPVEVLQRGGAPEPYRVAQEVCLWEIYSRI